MSNAITTAAVMTCPHGGKITIASSDPTLTIDGSPVYTVADLLSAAIACPNNPPCTAITDPGATLLVINGSAVLLADALGTNETPPPPAVGTSVTNAPTDLTLS